MSPYEALGLIPGQPVTDDDIRAAWRRVAAATHPDREDGGDAERFALAAAAYNELRTEYRRNEARAASVAPGAAGRRQSAAVPALIRLAIATAAVAAGILFAPDQATMIAILVGALTWLLLSIRGGRA